MSRLSSQTASLLRRVAPRGNAAGALWSGVNAGAAVALPFLIFIFFAHVLEPVQIGTVVLAISCAEFIKAMGMSGLYEAILQHEADQRRYHETMLAALLLAGGALLPIYAGVLALLEHFSIGGGVASIALLAIGLRIPLDLATLQPQAALAQRLWYRRMALRSVIANLGAGAIGIGLAAGGAPLAGLVAYQVGQSALLFLATVLGTGTLVRPRLHRDCLRRLAREAGMASVVRLVAATNTYVDQILVAGMLGNARLAYFNLAKRVETSFVTVSASFSAILFQPLFAARQGVEREPVLRKGLAGLALLCGLPAVFLAVNGAQLVPLVFGDRWQPAAPAVALLAVSGLVRALGGVHGALLSVTGRNNILAAASTTSAVAGVVAVLVTARHGVIWCAAGLTLKNVAVTCFLAASTRHDVPGMARAYLLDVVLPLALMALGAEAGRALAAAALPGAALMPLLGGMATSLLMSTVCGLSCFAQRVLGPAPLPAAAGR